MPSAFRWIVLPVLLLGIVFAIFLRAEDFPAKPPEKPRVLVTISKETTYITEPLRADGYPDYVAALNQRFSRGVTPENNAAVLFWKAMGPGSIEEKDRKKYFEMLGIAPLPEKGDYFVDFGEYVKRQQKGKQPETVQPPVEGGCDPMMDQYGMAQGRPWSKQEFPEVFEWLKANEKPLALLIEASKRPRRYDPIISNTWSIADILGLLPVQQYRVGVRALKARVMLRIREGKVNEAWEDLFTCHRLGRLSGQGPTVVEALVAIAIDGTAFAGDQKLLEHAKPTAAQIAKMQQEFDQLPPLPKMADKIDLGERFLGLDGMLRIAREGLAAMNYMEPRKKPANMMESLMHSIDVATIDGDLLLRMSNSWCDRMVDALRKPTWAEQKEAMDKINEDVKECGKLAKDWKSLALSMLSNPRETRSRQMGQMFSALCIPALAAAINAENRGNMQFELDKLAFALAAYRADHDSYPAKLADLTPKYVALVPKDVFNDAELHYRQEADGYLLYSVGINGRDDGGKGVEDRSEENPEDWDDLVVRMPAAKQAVK